MSLSTALTELKEMGRKTTAVLPLACVARVSLGLGSKEKPSNGIFGVLPKLHVSFAR